MVRYDVVEKIKSWLRYDFSIMKMNQNCETKSWEIVTNTENEVQLSLNCVEILRWKRLIYSQGCMTVKAFGCKSELVSDCE